MGKILGWFIIIIVGLVVAINALFMLICPRAWLRLPKWIRATDHMTEEQYGSGLGAAQVRMLGVGLLSVIIWFLYDFFLR